MSTRTELAELRAALRRSRHAHAQCRSRLRRARAAAKIAGASRDFYLNALRRQQEYAVVWRDAFLALQSRQSWADRIATRVRNWLYKVSRRPPKPMSAETIDELARLRP